MATLQQQYRFLELAAPIAKDIQKRYGIPFHFSLAQTILETGYGMFAPGNMYFGIKATPNWTGKVQMLNTTEYVDGQPKRVLAGFRAYDSMKDSFEDYAKLLTGLKRYKPAFKYPDDAIKFGEAIVKGGYATDINYIKKIKTIIDDLKKKVL